MTTPDQASQQCGHRCRTATHRHPRTSQSGARFQPVAPLHERRTARRQSFRIESRFVRGEGFYLAVQLDTSLLIVLLPLLGGSGLALGQALGLF
jgi:hypothetical protein